MSEVKEILHDILEIHKPSPEEAAKIVSSVKDFITKLDTHKEKMGIQAEIMLGGSVAKGTFLKTKFDSDVFIRFGGHYNNEDLSDLLEKMLEPFKKYNIVRIHGSRDYFQLKYQGVNFELVPVLKITNPKEALNVTDASPLHVKWVKGQLKKKEHLKDDVRLTKLFLKAQRIYGAESYIQGFSGHVTDVLIIHYDGFMNLLKNAAEWDDKVCIDIMGHGCELNKAKTYSPLILIDPVQPERNAAAALSFKKFDKFRQAAKKFLEDPTDDFFIEKKITIEELEASAGKNKLIIIKAKPLEGKNDVIGCKMLKVFEHIKRHLGLHDFEVIEAGWEWDGNALYWFILEYVTLEEYKKWIGPPLESTDHVAAFCAKHTETFEEDGRICSKIKRKFLKSEDFIKNVIKEDFIKNKILSISSRLH